MTADVPEQVRVVVADDQTMVREGLRSMLSMMDGIDVVGVARSAEEALDQVRTLQPDVLLTDLRMPGIGGVEGIRRLRASGCTTQAVALTTYDDDATIADALSAGALGFLTKDADPHTLAAASEAAATGRSLLDPAASAAMLRAIRTAARPPTAVPAPRSGAPDGLTDREAEVLTLIAAGYSNGRIAGELYVSMSTVKTHINHLLAKTRCRDRAGLVRYAYRHGLAG